jgi:hypothetical protein
MCFFCFPSESSVMTVTGPKKMKDLSVGDNVRVITSDGRVEFSPTVGWLHREPEGIGAYLRITTSRRQIHISDAHLLATVKAGRVEYVPASEAVAGTAVLECDTAPGPNGSVAVWGNTVQRVEKVQMKGIFAPLTEAGTIVVDGVGASCYACTKSHKAAHAAMKPMRSMYRHSPEKMKQQNHVGKHIQGSHRYVDVLARVTGKV